MGLNPTGWFVCPAFARQWEGGSGWFICQNETRGGYFQIRPHPGAKGAEGPLPPS